MQRTTFSDIPTELLFKILDQDDILSSLDLIRVASLSQQLNIIALTVFFGQHGIPQPRNMISLYLTDWNEPHCRGTTFPDVLCGLMIANHLETVDKLTCYFQDPHVGTLRNTYQIPINLPVAVRRLSRFVKRLTTIRTVQLYLVSDSYFLFRQKTLPLGVTLAELEDWSRALGELLSLLIERGCGSLTVQYDSHIDHMFQFHSTYRIPRLLSNVGQAILRSSNHSPLPNVRWEFRRSGNGVDLGSLGGELTELKYDVRTGSSLHSISLHTPALLLPPLYRWTLSLLQNSSSLTSLTFGHITLPKTFWETLLPVMAQEVSTKLTTLSFFKSCSNLTTRDLLKFISHLPLLTYLFLDRSLQFSADDSSTSGRTGIPMHPFTTRYLVPELPHLMTLHAPADFVFHFLNGKTFKTAVPLPKLKGIVVYPCRQLLYPSSYVTAASAVNSLCKSVKEKPHLQTVSFALDDQMDNTDFQLAMPYVDASTKFLQDEALGSNFSNRPPIFDDIEHLILYKFNIQANTDHNEAFIRWLKHLFPLLSKLSFTCQLPARPENVLETGLNVETIEWLLEELRKQCSNIRNLVIAQRFFTREGNGWREHANGD
jgi:hypothetical protein